MIKRRSFLTYFSLGWLTTCFPVVLAACAPKSGSQSTANGDSSSVEAKPVAQKTAEGFTIIGSITQLEKAGYLQTKEVAVLIDPANPKQLLAVSPKCTHEGCDVKWMAGEKKYECPCHGADFAADGKVLNGPTKQNLTTYPAKIVGTQVLVKI